MSALNLLLFRAGPKVREGFLFHPSNFSEVYNIDFIVIQLTSQDRRVLRLNKMTQTAATTAAMTTGSRLTVLDFEEFET